MKPPKTSIADLVDRMPPADKPGEESKFTGPQPKEAEKIVAEILQAGRDGLLQLLDLLRWPGEEGYKDYRAQYALHCIALHLGGPDKESQRRMFAETLASHLGGSKHSKVIQALLIRELQVAGRAEVSKVLGGYLLDDELCDPAAMALVAIGDGAAEQLRSAFPRAKGRKRVTLAQALGDVGDTKSVPALKEALGESDSGVRIAAARSLAMIGDPSAVDAVIQAADAREGWERIQITKSCLLLAEKLQAGGKKDAAGRIYKHLRRTREDPSERYIRDAAKNALAGGEEL